MTKPTQEGTWLPLVLAIMLVMWLIDTLERVIRRVKP